MFYWHRIGRKCAENHRKCIAWAWSQKDRYYQTMPRSMFSQLISPPICPPRDRRIRGKWIIYPPQSQEVCIHRKYCSTLIQSIRSQRHSSLWSQQNGSATAPKTFPKEYIVKIKLLKNWAQDHHMQLQHMDRTTNLNHEEQLVESIHFLHQDRCQAVQTTFIVRVEKVGLSFFWVYFVDELLQDLIRQFKHNIVGCPTCTTTGNARLHIQNRVDHCLGFLNLWIHQFQWRRELIVKEPGKQDSHFHAFRRFLALPTRAKNPHNLCSRSGFRVLRDNRFLTGNICNSPGSF